MSAVSKKIGVVTATIVGMNAMIGAGIFSVPAALGSAVGPAGLLTYIFVVGAIWCMGSSMAQLAQLYPQEGSFYTYARQWGGHYVGLLAMGLYLIGLSIAMGLLCQIIGIYLHHYFPYISAYMLGLAALAFLAILNMIGVHMSQAGQMILICTTVFPILIIIALCVLNGDVSNFIPFAPFGYRATLSATRIVIFGFFGFECAASLFNIVENPKKNVPRALVAAIILVGLLYMVFVGSIIFAVPLHYFANPNATISGVLIQLFPKYTWIFEIVHIAILSAIIGTVHSMLWSAGSLLTSFLKQTKSVLFHRLATNGYVNDRCSVFLVSLAILTSFLLLSNLDLFFSLTALFLVCAFMLSMIALLFRKNVLNNWEYAQLLIGLMTAALILYFAVEKIVFLNISS